MTNELNNLTPNREEPTLKVKAGVIPMVDDSTEGKSPGEDQAKKAEEAKEKENHKKAEHPSPDAPKPADPPKKIADEAKRLIEQGLPDDIRNDPRLEAEKRKIEQEYYRNDRFPIPWEVEQKAVARYLMHARGKDEEPQEKRDPYKLAAKDFLDKAQRGVPTIYSQVREDDRYKEIKREKESAGHRGRDLEEETLAQYLEEALGGSPAQEAGAGGGGGKEPPEQPPASPGGGEGNGGGDGNGHNDEDNNDSQENNERNEEEDREMSARIEATPYMSIYKRIKELFENPVLREELASEKPDFTRPELSDLKEFIKDLNPSSTAIDYEAFLDIVVRFKDERGFQFRDGLRQERSGQVRKVLEVVEGTGSPDDIRISQEASEVLFEWLVERIISIPDDTPDSHYDYGGLYIQSTIDDLKVAAEAYYRPEFKAYIKELIHNRQTAHDFGISLSQGDQYKEFIQKMRAPGIQFLFSEIVGVREIFALYEKASTQRVAEAVQWWDDGDAATVERYVEQIANGLFDEGELKAHDGRKLTDWEKDRALRIARIFFAGLQRMAVYSGLGDLPSMSATPKRIGSVPYEYMARAIYNFKTAGPRFFANDASGSKAYLKHVFWREEERINRDGGGDKYISLFGLDRETMMMNTMGSYDILSQGWRIPLVFFGEIRYVDPATGEVKDILQTVNEFGQRTGVNLGDPILGGESLSGDQKSQLSSQLKQQFLKERLYYSPMAKYGHIDHAFKEEIWKKSAILRPSVVAALLPQIREKGNARWDPVWDTLKIKLMKAEQKRVIKDTHDFQAYNEYLSLRRTHPSARTQKQQERIAYFEAPGEGEDPRSIYQRLEDARTEEFNNFTQRASGQIDAGSGDYAFQLLNDMRNDLTADEAELLKKVIQGGYKNAEKIAHAKVSHTYAIDDAPFMNWQKSQEGLSGISSEDIFRILISDQENFAKGWTAVNSLVESPHKADVVKAMAEAVNTIGIVPGRRDAQQQLEPFTLAWMDMAKRHWKYKLPMAMTYARMNRIPTSEMEHYFRESLISYDEEEMSDLAMALAQNNILSDNLEKDKKETQLERVMRIEKATPRHKRRKIIRLILYLLPVGFATALLKAILPSEVTKDLGL